MLHVPAISSSGGEGNFAAAILCDATFRKETWKDTRCIPLEKRGDGTHEREEESRGMSPRWSREFSRKEGRRRELLGSGKRLAFASWARVSRPRLSRIARKGFLKYGRSGNEVAHACDFLSRLSKLAKSSLEPTTFRFLVAFSRKIKFPVETTPACERASLHHRI